MFDTIQKTFPAMGSVFALSINGPEHFAEAERIKAYLLTLDAAWSVFREDSEISRLNRHAGRGMLPVSPDTLRILSESVLFAGETGGAFDITAGALTSLWRKAVRAGKTPMLQDVRSALAHIDAGKLRIDPEAGKAGLAAGQSIDLGGIAKGCAVDRTLERLRAAGVETGLLNFGGTVAALGEPAWIGIQNPFRPTGVPLGTLLLQNRCAVTSGSYARYAEIGGRRYHHILDPRTGYPSGSGLCSVTLIGENAAMLDAFATATLIFGAETAAPLLRRHGIDAVFIDETGEIFVTEGLRDTFRLCTDVRTA